MIHLQVFWSVLLLLLLLFSGVVQGCNTQCSGALATAEGTNCTTAEGIEGTLFDCDGERTFNNAAVNDESTVQSVCCPFVVDSVDTADSKTDLPYKREGLQLAGAIFTLFLRFVAFVVSACLIISILRAKSVRTHTFNLYLVAIILPDLLNIVGVVTGIFQLVKGQMMAGHCEVSTFTVTYFTCTNLWMNAITAREVTTLLHNCRHGRRASPPPKQRFLRQACFVYGLLGLPISLLGSVLLCEHLPAKDHNQEVLYGLIFLYCSIGILVPIGYVLFACFWLWWKGLMKLGSNGRAKYLARYFFRIVFVFFFFWVPQVVLGTIWVKRDASLPYLYHANNVLLALQSLVSVAMAVSKPDIYRALVAFLLCKEVSSEWSSSPGNVRVFASSTLEGRTSKGSHLQVLGSLVEPTSRQASFGDSTSAT